MKHLLPIVALLAFPLSAHAGRKEKAAAKKHIQAATKAHKAQQFDVALSELQAAYELDPQPDVMYAIGQVQVKLGNCPEAIVSYEKFLEAKPAPEPTAAANEAISNCRDQLAAQQPAPPITPEPEPQPKPLPPPPKPAVANTAFYKDPIGDLLVGVGVAASVTGVVFYVGARGKLDDADHATTYAEQQSLVDDAHSKRNLALVVGGAGVVALGIGVWRYTRVGKSAEHQTVTVVPSRSGGLITWMGRF